ncbi:response regulator [Leptolyngbya sp. PL-A3]|uniref:response regulator n=1 Tax=Leptolyngbya sp. PL-A3 TaxID=2933911 RepID=UPI00329717EA
MARRILLIDDEETIQTVVQFGIQMTAGWQVLTASSGEEGVAIARTHQPHAILLDLIMPEMNGVATFKELKAHAEIQHIPVIFLTAQTHTHGEEWQSLPVDGMIPKPFNALELPSKIAHILNWVL